MPPDLFAQLLTDHDLNSYVGLRAALLVRLLAELGLRAGEAAGLRWAAVDLSAGTLAVDRPKVHTTQTMRLGRRLLALLRRYMDTFPDGMYLLWKLSAARQPVKDATNNGMSRAAVSMAIKRLGRQHGLDKLSAHDLRHHWTTVQHRNGVDSARLQRMGGWRSPAMLQTYIREREVVNDGHEEPYDV